MTREILEENVANFLRSQEFINIATCDLDNIPNVAPKFLLNIEANSIYLVDYVLGKTYRNLNINPKVSISTMNLDTLTGYQINGFAKILNKGKKFDKLIKEYHKKQVQFSVTRLINSVRSQDRSKGFEASLPDKVVIIEIRVEEIVEILTTGSLKRKTKS